MAKVPCHCTSHQCGGNLVDQRTQRSHRLRDQQFKTTLHSETNSETDTAQSALQAQNKVIRTELDTISDYLATTTLSDLSPFLYTPTKESSLRNQRVNRVLERLSEIEQDVNDLHEEVKRSLLRSQLPAFLNSEHFPLANLMEKCTQLNADLKKITYKSLAVTGARDSIQEQVDIARKTLQEAKHNWKRAREAMQERLSKPNDGFLEYSNGQFSQRL